MDPQQQQKKPADPAAKHGPATFKLMVSNPMSTTYHIAKIPDSAGLDHSKIEWKDVCSARELA